MSKSVKFGQLLGKQFFTHWFPNPLNKPCVYSPPPAQMCVDSTPGGSDGKESTWNTGDLGLILGLGRSPGGGHGNPLQYSYLENPIDRVAWGGGGGCSPWGCKESGTTELSCLA